MTKKKFYITAAIPYVNAAPHIGHALEFVQTNTIARYHQLLGEEVLSLSGGDENALKNVQAAEEANEPTQKFVDKNTELFRQLAIKLDAKFGIWQKGGDQKHHYPSSQKLWELCQKDIYKKEYSGLYCVGCETFYSPDELDENGECLEHPGKKLDKVSEENYFFALSKYQDKLIKIYEKDKIKIFPKHRKNEVLSFIKSGLEDISISRSNERAKNWGVPVPDDNTQRIYVWFDALNIYQSGIGFGWNDKSYKKWWPADLHVIGKGIIRFHAVYWPAFLLSAGLELPKVIFVHDYFTVNGQKMSKTLGNVIDPIKLVEEYGANAVRYYFLAKFNPFTDGDFSEEKLKEAYNADLANGLGNLVARVAKLCETSGFKSEAKPLSFQDILRVEKASFSEPEDEFNYKKNIEKFRFDLALNFINNRIRGADQFIDQEKPWELLNNTNREKLFKILGRLVEDILEIAVFLKPFLPQTAERIEKQFAGPKIKSGEPLFPRLK